MTVLSLALLWDTEWGIERDSNLTVRFWQSMFWYDRFMYIDMTKPNNFLHCTEWVSICDSTMKARRNPFVDTELQTEAPWRYWWIEQKGPNKAHLFKARRGWGGWSYQFQKFVSLALKLVHHTCTCCSLTFIHRTLPIQKLHSASGNCSAADSPVHGTPSIIVSIHNNCATEEPMTLIQATRQRII